jgi:hypothetical protein
MGREVVMRYAAMRVFSWYEEDFESVYCEPSSHSKTQEVDESYGINEGRLLRKLDFHLLPGVCVLYLLSFLDRSNVANARLDGLTDDLHMTGNQYLTGLTMFFVGYILLEVIWNVILKRVGPKLWLPAVTLAFGIVSTLQGVVVYNGGQTGVAGFLVVRFFLGVTEGGLFPGVVFYLSMWYKRAERQYRIALFFAMASLAGAFGGILAYGIGFMKGVAGLKGWVCIHHEDPNGLLTYFTALDLHHRRHLDVRPCRCSLLVYRRLALEGEVPQRGRKSCREPALEGR